MELKLHGANGADLTPEQIYQSQKRNFKALRREILHTLDGALSREPDLVIHSRSARVKTQESVIAKIGRKQYNGIADMVDIVGARVVCLYIKDIDRLEQLVGQCFEIVEVADHIDGGGKHEMFGYMSRHFVCRFGSTYAGTRYEAIKDIKFEIQCRTILMDAWANVSHHLAYKDLSLPESLRRDFNALAGLFYVADRHFEFFYNQSHEAGMSAITEVGSSAVDWDALPVDGPHVAALLDQMYPDRNRGGDGAIGSLTTELLDAGYEDLGRLRRVLQRAFDAADAYERDHPPGGRSSDAGGAPRYADVGQARNSLEIADHRYRALRRHSYPTSFFEPYESMLAPTD